MESWRETEKEKIGKKGPSEERKTHGAGQEWGEAGREFVDEKTKQRTGGIRGEFTGIHTAHKKQGTGAAEGMLSGELHTPGWSR